LRHVEAKFFRVLPFAALFIASLPARAQSTQGVLSGAIRDSITNLPLRDVAVDCRSVENRSTFAARTDDRGIYSILSLSPGVYEVTISAPDYQSQQARSLEVPVAERVELNFRLRPLADLWEAGRYGSWTTPESKQSLAFYGPDVDTSRIVTFNANLGRSAPLETTRSDVISPVAIENLPLIGRDAYALLVLLPGVTADTTTARGLGYSVNGQRPSSSNYLLDGVDNNNHLVTGPLSSPVPEFIQEYRISSSNFTAEYGGTGGFIANAVTVRGGEHFHGKAFFYFENDRLNAANFQENANSLGKSQLTQLQPGSVVSGPAIHGKLFWSAGFEGLRLSARSDPQYWALPTAGYVAGLNKSGYAGTLLNVYRPEITPAGPGDYAIASIAAPADYSRSNALARLDFSPQHRPDRIYTRFTHDAVAQPDLVFSPYRDFSTHYGQKSLSVAGGWTHSFSSTLMNEVRTAFTVDSIQTQSDHADVPQLVDEQAIAAPDGSLYPVQLPGAVSDYSYRNRGRDWEAIDNVTWIRGRHTMKGGTGIFGRSINLHLGYIEQGSLFFATLQKFATGQPNLLQVETDNYSSTPGYAAPNPNRNYRYSQMYLFAEDSFRITRRITLDYGTRYENFGSPLNTGPVKDVLFQLGSGPNIESSLAAATVVLPAGMGDQRLFKTTASAWSPRAGLAWDTRGNGKTVLRASYGIFYDPNFDNLWENILQSRYGIAYFAYTGSVTLPASTSALESAGTYQTGTPLIPGLVFQPKMKNASVQSAFAGVQQKLPAALSFEAYAMASRGRQLITTDRINRVSPTTGTAIDPLLDPLDYRANQGSSDYTAVEAMLRFQRQSLTGQISYTLSHSIDNQSEPLANAFFDLNLSSSAAKPASFFSAFTTQFASLADRSNSDFDQRQNLVFFFSWSPDYRVTNHFAHSLAHNWTLSALGAVRSGLPFSVYSIEAGIPTVSLINERANLVTPSSVSTNQPVPGGRLLLNSMAFATPDGAVGTSGRNEFYGPGLVSANLSISRSFRVPRSRETARAVIRADFYNVLNHANLNNPDPYYCLPGSPGCSPGFGVALFGRTETTNGFPQSAPLNETARQIQLMLRFEF
jgi:Carboxypeptidase regulatory-like domain